MPGPEIIGLKNVSVESDRDILLEDAAFSFNSDSRTAIVGSNGSGKSTLLKAIAGLAEVARGDIVIRKGALIEYVPQAIPPELMDVSVIDALLAKLERTRPDIEEWQAYDILTRFGFENMMDQTLGSLSGGEGNKAMLARALVVKPSFILLDEPTNHMDSVSIVKFERLLQSELRIPFCIVSHDRTLLNNVTSETIFLRDKRLYYFGLSFSKAKEALLQQDEARKKDYLEEAKEIERLTASAQRMQNWVRTNSDLATRYQALKRRVEVMKENRTFVSREKKKRLSVGSAELNVSAALRIRDLDVVNPIGTVLFHINELAVAPGDRIVILGINGAGKTSLLRMVVAAFEGADSPNIRLNPQVKLGYYDQELRQLKPEREIFTHVQDLTNLANDAVRKELIAAGFPFERHHDRIGTLSGGERARLQFAILKLQKCNVMILDEPTNHIDVEGIEHLEYEIDQSEATFIMVSHDRSFIDNVANRYFIIENGAMREVLDISDYYKMLSKSLEPDSPKEDTSKKKNGKKK